MTVTNQGEVLLDYKYAYDLNGNRLEKVGSKYKNYYQYDVINRLQQATYDGRTESFTYDLVGNRLTKKTNEAVSEYTYNIKNQLQTIQEQSGIMTFTYSKIKEDTLNGTTYIAYNALNQQTKVITKEGNILTSYYDSEGLRYEIVENEQPSKFIFHQGEILVETNQEDQTISRFTRGYCCQLYK